MDHFSQVLFYKDPFKSTIFTRSHAELLGDSKKAVSTTCDRESDVLINASHAIHMYIRMWF